MSRKHEDSLSASLVLYKNVPEVFEVAISSYIEGCDGFLYVVDNSPEPLESKFFSHPKVSYKYIGKNLGFGAGHNSVLLDNDLNSIFHLILNPDVSFDTEVLPALQKMLSEDPSVGAVMPRITYPNGDPQLLCKLLPTPVDLIVRRFFPDRFSKYFGFGDYVLEYFPEERPFDVPNLSGCFLLVRTDILKNLRGFDERFFMYLEDIDLVRRVGLSHRTVCDPRVSVAHGYAKGSYKDRSLLAVHTVSAIRYFNKWGWIFDSERSEINKNCLAGIPKVK